MGNSDAPDAGVDVALDSATDTDAIDATADSAPCPGAGCLKPQQLNLPGATCGGMHLAVTTSELFWTDTAAASVSALATTTQGFSGGIQSLLDGPTLIAATGRTVYWLNSTSKTIRYSSAPSGSTLFTTLYEDAHAMRLSAGVQNRLYVSQGMAVRWYPGNGTVATEESGVPAAVAFDASNIAFAVMGDKDIDVVSLAVNYGTPATCTAPASANPSVHCSHVVTAQSALLLDTLEMANSRVIWANGGTLYSRPADLSTPAQALATTAFGGAITTFVLQGSTVFLAEDGYIEAATLTTMDTATVLATGQSQPRSMVADDARIYWVNADCSIMSVVR